MALLYHLRQMKSQGHIHPYPVKVLSNALGRLIDADLLIMQENRRFQQYLTWADVSANFVNERDEAEESENRAS